MLFDMNHCLQLKAFFFSTFLVCVNGLFTKNPHDVKGNVKICKHRWCIGCGYEKGGCLSFTFCIGKFGLDQSLLVGASGDLVIGLGGMVRDPSMQGRNGGRVFGIEWQAGRLMEFDGGAGERLWFRRH